jgi:hypothetical protein
LYRNSKCLSFTCRKLLCSALIQFQYPFDYSCSSWYESLNKSLKKKLQVAQNKVIRFIKDYHPRTSLTPSDFTDVNMLNIENRVRLNHMHTFFYNKCPTYMKTNFARMPDIHNYNTGSNKLNFSIPHYNKTCNGTFFL